MPNTSKHFLLATLCLSVLFNPYVVAKPTENDIEKVNSDSEPKRLDMTDGLNPTDEKHVLRNTSPTISTSLSHSKIIDAMKQSKKLEKDAEFSTEKSSSSEETDLIEYVPVSLQHPLFKIFGINPNDYLVYYKYKQHEQNLDDNLPDIPIERDGTAEVLSSSINPEDHTEIQEDKHNSKRSHKISDKTDCKKEPKFKYELDNGVDPKEDMFEIMNPEGFHHQHPVVIVPVPYPVYPGQHPPSCSCCNSNNHNGTQGNCNCGHTMNPFPYVPQELLHGYEFDLDHVPYKREGMTGVYPNRRRRKAM